jgi:membrane dipeptidase
MSEIMQPTSHLTASPEAVAFTRSTFVFDCLTLNYALEDEYAARCREGGVDAFNLTVASEEQSWDETLRLTDEFLTRIGKSPYLQQATDSTSVAAARRAGKTAVILGTQGSAMIDDKVWRVGVLHRLGFRYFGLAYTGATMFGDGCGELRDAGVSFLGRDLIAAMNEINMILDLSHSGHRTRAEATEFAKWPVCTHSNAYAVTPNDRNTKDEAIRAITAKGGMVGLCGLPRSVSPDGQPTLAQMVEHARHIVGLVGHEKLGIGLDFVEGWVEATKAGRSNHKPPKWRTLRPDIFGRVEDFFTDSYPRGMHSIRLLPNLTQAFFDEGWTKEQVAAVLGGNWLRHFTAACG